MRMNVSARFISLMILFVLLLAFCTPACAEVFFAQPPAQWEEKDLLRITCFDVNEGDAMLLECGGEIMMIDGGPNPSRDALLTRLQELGYLHFKYLFSTHFHDDHINGLYHIMRYGVSADEFIHSYNPITIEANKLHGRTIRQADRIGVPNRKVGEGDVLTLGSAVLNVHRYSESNNANGRSLTVKLYFGDTSVLFCADIIGKTQEYFYQTLPAEELKADIIKFPHHGINACNSDFLDTVDPAFALVTNRKKVAKLGVNQLEGRGIPALYSGDGTVYCVTDGTDWYVWQTEGLF